MFTSFGAFIYFSRCIRNLHNDYFKTHVQLALLNSRALFINLSVFTLIKCTTCTITSHYTLIPIQAQTRLTTLVKGLVIELLQVGDIELCGASYILIINISCTWGHNTKMIKNIFNKFL